MHYSKQRKPFDFPSAGRQERGHRSLGFHLRNILIALIAVAAVYDICAVVKAQTGNLIVNGGFEEPVISSGFQVFSSIPGWAALPGSPDFELQSGVAGDPFEGNQHCELDGFAPSAIFQDVPTTPGRVYELSFAFSARPGTPLTDNVLRVSWGGQEITSLTKDGTGLSNTLWDVHKFQVLGGQGTTTRLVFEDLGVANTFGAYIDDVRVIDLGFVITTSLPRYIQLGVPFSMQLQAGGGETPLVWSLIGGALPTGLNLGADGVLSGIPTTLGQFTFTVRVTDNNGETAEKEFTVEVVLIVPPANCIPVPSGLVGWWDADSVSGTTAFDLAGENDGTMTGGVGIVPGIVGNAFGFDGVDDFVTMGNVLNFERTDAFSVFAWIRITNADIFPIIVRKMFNAEPFTGYTLHLHPEGTVAFEIRHSGSNRLSKVSIPTVKDGNWHFVGFTYDGSSTLAGTKIYIDGVEVATDQGFDTLTQSILTSAPLQIGATDGPNRVFNGKIDEVQIFNRELSASEVSAEFNAGSAGKCKVSVCSQFDNTPPVITACATDKTISANSSCQASIPDLTSEVMATDNCAESSTLTITQSPAPGAWVGLGATPVTITVKDASGNMSTCTATVTVVDDSPPDTNLTSMPAAVSGANVSFGFSSSDNCNSTSFECELDSGGWTACTSPQSYNGLANGAHTFQVRAKDAAGNVDSTPAMYTWQVFTASCGTVVNPPTLAQAWLGIPYAQAFSALPIGSYSFSLLAGTLPPGLQLTNVLGVYLLKGTPTTPGTYTFTIKAKKNNSTCEGARTYTMVIAPTVIPIVECLQNNGNGTFTAFFGYDNSTGAAVTIPVGANNYFTPGAQNRGQTTVFQPGRVHNAFSVTFTISGGNNLAIWLLKGPDGLLRAVNITTAEQGCP